MAISISAERIGVPGPGIAIRIVAVVIDGVQYIPSGNAEITLQKKEGTPVNVDRGTMTLLDTEKVALSIAAKDLGGVARAIPAEQYTWLSSDESVVRLEPHEDPYARWAITPNPGQSKITVTGPTGDTETLMIVVQVSGPGEIGLSGGSPIPE